MAIDPRTITMLAQWAKNALTSIPSPPVPDIAYRDPNLSVSDVETGQKYSTLLDSSDWNQLFYLITGLIMLAEQYGIIPWSEYTNYKAGSVTLGPDGIIYQALADSGPSTTPRQPPNATYWKTVTVGDASTGQKGSIQIATQAEVNTGTNGTKAVVPAHRATQTNYGLTRLATATEASAGTSNAVASTPAQVKSAVPTLPLSVDNGGTGASTITGDKGAALNFFPTNLTDSAAHVMCASSAFVSTGYIPLQSLRNRMGLGDTTEALPIANGGTGANAANSAALMLFPSNLGDDSALAHVMTVTSAFNKSGYVPIQSLRNRMGLGNTLGVLPIANGGTGNTAGLAASATILANARSIQTNLSSTSSVSFNGSANITPGVLGVLPVTNGGTGRGMAFQAPYGPLVANSDGNIISNLPSGTAGQVFVSSGNNWPGFKALDLSNANAVTGILPITRGGTGVNNAVVVVETWVSGTSWYRKWSDGWIEQGGVDGPKSGTVDNYITLHKAFSNTSYHPSAIVRSGGVNEYNDMWVRPSSNTQFIWHSGAIEQTTVTWFACGY